MKSILIAGSVVVLAGCTNLDAVREISTRLNSASGSWKTIGNEFAASCRREAGTNPAIRGCELPEAASSGLSDVADVLSGYFKALAHAADETAFTIQPGLDAASGSAARIPGIEAEQVKAVSGLVGLLARLGGDALREATLRTLISDGGPQARTIVRALDGLVVGRLRLRLGTERMQLTGHFDHAIKAEHNVLSGGPATLCSGSAASAFNGTGYLLALEYCRRSSDLDRRDKALTDYQASLIEADKALAELESAKTELKAGALAKRLHAIGSDIDEKVSAVRKAFA